MRSECQGYSIDKHGDCGQVFEANTRADLILAEILHYLDEKGIHIQGLNKIHFHREFIEEDGKTKRVYSNGSIRTYFKVLGNDSWLDADEHMEIKIDNFKK